MTNQQSIKDTLSVIRKALEDESNDNSHESIDNNILILNRLVKNDGTIDLIEESKFDKSDVKEVLNDKLDELFDQYFTKWLDKNLPSYIEKYFKNKNN